MSSLSGQAFTEHGTPNRLLQELITDLATTLATLKVCKGGSCVVKSLSVTEPQPA